MTEREVAQAVEPAADAQNLPTAQHPWKTASRNTPGLQVRRPDEAGNLGVDRWLVSISAGHLHDDTKRRHLRARADTLYHRLYPASTPMEIPYGPACRVARTRPSISEIHAASGTRVRCVPRPVSSLSPRGKPRVLPRPPAKPTDPAQEVGGPRKDRRSPETELLGLRDQRDPEGTGTVSESHGGQGSLESRGVRAPPAPATG